MKVYVLIGDMGYYGSYLMGVYSSEELAEKAFKEHPNTELMVMDQPQKQLF